MQEITEELVKSINDRLGPRHRMPFHTKHMYARVSIRQPNSTHVYTYEFSYPNYTGTSHPSERDLQSTARKVYTAMCSAFGNAIRFGGIPHSPSANK